MLDLNPAALLPPLSVACSAPLVPLPLTMQRQPQPWPLQVHQPGEAPAQGVHTGLRVHQTVKQVVVVVVVVRDQAKLLLGL